MVRVLSAVAFVLAISMGVQASATCQCLFQDGSHCCVYAVSPPTIYTPTGRRSQLKRHVLSECKWPSRGLHQRLPRQTPVYWQRCLRSGWQMVSSQRMERPVAHRMRLVTCLVWNYGKRWNYRWRGRWGYSARFYLCPQIEQIILNCCSEYPLW